MNEEDYFLRAIADRPEDDAARLVYADWLEERGDPRAEFIRLEVTLGPGPRLDPRRLAMADRMAERGNKDFADYIRREDPWHATRENRRRQLLAGIGAGWLAAVSRRGPFLLALGRGESVALGLTSRGCYHHRSCRLVFSGPVPLRGEVTELANRGEPTGRPRPPFGLKDRDLDRLDALLEHCRTTAEKGESITTNLIELEWHSGGIGIHKESFADRGTSVA